MLSLKPGNHLQVNLLITEEELAFWDQDNLGIRTTQGSEPCLYHLKLSPGSDPDIPYPLLTSSLGDI